MPDENTEQSDTQETQEDSYLGMSDEDFTNLDSNIFDEQSKESDDTKENSDEDKQENAEEPSKEEPDQVDDTESGEDANETGDKIVDDPNTENSDDKSDNSSDKNSDTASDDDSEAGDDDQADKSDDADKPDEKVDAQAFLAKVTGEFRANGRDMKVDNAEDVIRLMQMGANYSRKMAALKPNMKVLKMLEKNELLDESKLNFLIDLEKKNPEAIAKLLADSKIDPLDLNAKTGSEYKAADHSVGNNEIELGSIVESIEDTPTYNQTIEVVTKQWDATSKQTVTNEPHLLRVINDHMASGIYDVISTEIEKERMFGRLDNISDIEAYKQVGDSISARGGFAHLFKNDEGQQDQGEATEKTAAKKQAEKKRRDKRRAASPSKPAAPTSKDTQDFNPLGMSDEDYLKQYDEKFL
jgi:hypothetical protein